MKYSGAIQRTDYWRPLDISVFTYICSYASERPFRPQSLWLGPLIKIHHLYFPLKIQRFFCIFFWYKFIDLNIMYLGFLDSGALHTKRSSHKRSSKKFPSPNICKYDHDVYQCKKFCNITLQILQETWKLIWPRRSLKFAINS